MSLLKLLCPTTWKLGKQPVCDYCAAGGLLNFRWHESMENPKIRHSLGTFEPVQKLRWGRLFKCKACNQPWYLDEYGLMNSVLRDRLSLIYEWNAHAIFLLPKHICELEHIGRTPPDSYGNGSQFHETPCGVVTKSGEQIDLAIISRQKHAPFEGYRQYRLASEVDEIYMSPYALPLPVRIATAMADEIHMGFSPTLIELPGGELVVLNWRQNFFVREGYKASEVILAEHKHGIKAPPEIYSLSKNVIYFVADLEVEGETPQTAL